MRKLVLALLLLSPFAADAQAPLENSVTSNPTLLEAAAPTYPHSRFKNPDRTVLVALTVNTDGLPEKVRVVQTGGDRFDKNAVDTVRQYKFRPAQKAGQPVAQEIQVEVNYKSK